MDMENIMGTEVPTLSFDVVEEPAVPVVVEPAVQFVRPKLFPYQKTKMDLSTIKFKRINVLNAGNVRQFVL